MTLAFGMSPQPFKVQQSDLADPWRRVLAHLIDAVLLFATLIVGWLIWAVILLWFGQTPGLQLLKMRVIDLSTGQRASFGKMFLREVVVTAGLMLVTAPLSPVFSLLASISLVIPMFFNPFRQDASDLMVGTSVVDDPDGRFPAANP